MSFPDNVLEDIRNRISLVEVVSRQVRLVRRGREHTGLCPFHTEKTPSFTVNEERYHCFGCGVHGSLFDYVMQTERLSFPQAVERLAALAGVTLPQPQAKDREQQRHRQHLVDLVEQAVLFFEQTLRSPDGEAARHYLAGRGVDDAAIRRFRLGYAPAGRSTLRSTLARTGISEAAMVEAGLLVQPDDQTASPYDRFRGRVIFPIADRRGRIVGFGGRLLGQGEPKYLNSPDTPLFHKGRLLYGMPAATEAARRTGRLIVVEGYMDAIGLALAGYEETVAPLGTALTVEQLQDLWRLTPAPILCFDPDVAGRRAAMRACERALPLLRPGLGLRFAFLGTDTGDDPDAVVRRYSRRHLDAALSSALPLSAMLVRLVTGGRSPATPEERAAAIDRLRKCADAIADSAVRIQFHAHIGEVARNLMLTSSRAARGSRRAQPIERVLTHAEGHDLAASPSSIVEAEQTVLAILINHSELFSEVEESIGRVTFSRPELELLRLHLVSTLSGTERLSRPSVVASLETAGLNFDARAVLEIPWLSHISHPTAHQTRDQQNARLIRKWFNKGEVDDNLALDELRRNLQLNIAIISHAHAAEPATTMTGDITDAVLTQRFARRRATLDEQEKEQADNLHPNHSPRPQK